MLKIKNKNKVGTESFIQERFTKILEKKGFKIISKKELKGDEKGWDIVAGKKYKQKSIQRKYYFEIKGKANKKANRKDQHRDVALVRGIGQLVIRLQKPTIWYRHFILVLPESFERAIRSKLKNSYGWYLLAKKTPINIWFVNDYGQIKKKCPGKSFYKGKLK
ncbi:hypothetical protein KJ671_02230 [Patescibacteria group bacterium]|nr:hypothetical protein [Patescibacteria group bacterium]